MDTNYGRTRRPVVASIEKQTKIYDQALFLLRGTLFLWEEQSFLKMPALTM
jgi:hypothetical protein